MSKIGLGILGEHISYTLSPRIFEWAFQKTGIDAEYRAFDLPGEKARDFLINDSSWKGLSVTTPHKSLAAEVCDEMSDEARTAEAVNAVSREGNTLIGYNTDVRGFHFALKQMSDRDFAPRNALVIGSGGAARAVSYALSERYPQMRAEVATRDVAGAKARLATLMNRFRSWNCIDLETAAHFLKDFDLVIQATPVGSEKLPGCPLPGPLKFQNNSLVIDLIYAPRQTRLLQQADACRARTQNGLVMLIAQAAENFRLWTGIEFPLDEAMNDLLPELMDS